MHGRDEMLTKFWLEDLGADGGVIIDGILGK
jgi:hypothetical protein